MENKKCSVCGLPNFPSSLACKRCGAVLSEPTEGSNPIIESSITSTENKQLLVTRSQGYSIIVLLGVLTAVVAWGALKGQVSIQKFEYKTVEFMSESRDRTGAGAMAYSSIQISESQLELLGSEGWELTDSILEVETAYPNFGDTNYVTGLQPNVRPQRVVLFFKRRIR